MITDPKHRDTFHLQLTGPVRLAIKSIRQAAQDHLEAELEDHFIEPHFLAQASQVFMKLSQGDEAMTLDELYAATTRLGPSVSQKVLQKLFATLDKDGGGHICDREWLAFLNGVHGRKATKKLRTPTLTLTLMLTLIARRPRTSRPRTTGSKAFWTPSAATPP